jgi:hypothetical protein
MLLNQCGKWEAALERLHTRRFSPWEGGEGLVSAQYVQAQRSLGKACLLAGKAGDALRHFETARSYPENLGEGKHLLTLERDLDYYSGLAAQQLGDATLAHRYWKAGAAYLAGMGIHSYFQALSELALGNDEAGRAVLSELQEFSATRLKTEPKIDYFATSLPNLLLFDDDLLKRNTIDSLLLSALASHGLGDPHGAIRQLEQVAALDPNHQFAAETLEWLNLEITLSTNAIEVSPAP